MVDREPWSGMSDIPEGSRGSDDIMDMEKPEVIVAAKSRTANIAWPRWLRRRDMLLENESKLERKEKSVVVYSKNKNSCPF